MKKFYTILCLTIASLTQLQAQAPQGFNYQATVRNSSGDLIVNTNVYFKFNVMQGSQTSLPVFTETHYVPTDDLGQVNLVIGQGTANTGVFSELDWSLGSYYLGIELDTGSGYVAMGTTQLLSVPYAMYAETSGNATSTTPNLQSVLTENNSAGQQQIKNLLDPTDGSDAVTKSYVDALSGSQGLMNFNGWDNYQVWNDGTSVQLTPNSFVFVNANDTTLVFPDGPDNPYFGDVIYVYVMDGDPLTPLSFNLQANGFPVAVGGGDMPLEFTSTDIISGEFNTVGLKTIVNVGDYWMVADFQGQIITDSDIDNDGDGFTENQGDCDDNNATIYPPVIPTYQQITICSGDTFVFDPVNNPPTTLVPDGTTYTWAVQENTSIITGQSSSNNNQSQISQTLVNLTSDIYGLVYEVTPYSSSGCVGSVFQLSVLVVPSPVLEPINDMVLMNGEFGEIVFYPYTADNSATITYDWVSDIDFGAGLSGEGDIFNFFATNSSSIPITGIVNVSATVTYNGTSCFGPSETFTVTVCAEEIQDGIDNDCDGEIDEGFDNDGDGYTVGQGDCDDYDASINPGATEIEDGIDNDCDGEVDEGFGHSGISGTWRLAPEAGALGVGPELDNVSWWSNSSDDVTTRACLFDDTYVFNADGSFQNVVGDQTWIEAWQGAASEECGAPVAPHDGSATATYTYDEAAGTITLNGVGAYLGLAKAINGGELTSPADAPDSVTYLAALSEDGNTLELDIEIAGGGHWSFKLVKDVIPEGVEGTWKLAPEAGAIGVGPELDNISWWSNSSDDVTTRACLFDDEYVFGADGSFQNVVGADTWIEPWQGVASEGCGTPVAPHDGSATATYTYDESAGSITLNGTGAYLGLAKVINGAELASPADAPGSVTYIASLSADGLTLELDIEVAGGGHWSFKLARQNDIDNDNDGYTENQGDCDDNNAQINPGTTEIEDGIDNDCDGDIDEGFNDDYCPPFSVLVYGTQEWSGVNACNTTYRDGTPIPQFTGSNSEWDSLTTGAWSYYNNDPTRTKVYNWYAVMGIHDAASLSDLSLRKEFAPEGWHVPLDAEWTTLENYFIANGYNYDGTTTGNKIGKAMASTTGWNTSAEPGAVGNDQSLNNSSGFNAYPEGFGGSNYGAGQGEGLWTVFWSSNESDISHAWSRSLNNFENNLYRYNSVKFNFISVRLVRD